MSSKAALALLIVVILCCPAVALPQERSKKADEQQEETIELKGTLVGVPVVVRDSDNRYVVGLQKSDFKIFEDGVEQEIVFFSRTEEPFSVALLLDTSGSTEEELPRIQSAATAFVQQLHPQDQVMVISFDDEVRVECEFTSDRQELIRAIRSTRSGQSTHLYEAVYLAVEQRMNKVKGRKAMVLFTDGVDTASQDSSYEETVRYLEESNVLAYSIRYDTREAVARRLRRPKVITMGRLPIPIPVPQPAPNPAPGRTPWPLPPQLPYPTPVPRRSPQPSPVPGPYPQPQPTPQPNPTPRRVPRQPNPPDDESLDAMYRRGEAYLRELADKTGGVYYEANTLNDLPSVFEQIANELRQQYTLGYYPTNSKQDGGYRKIKVKVNRPGAYVRARPGYRAPKK